MAALEPRILSGLGFRERKKERKGIQEWKGRGLKISTQKEEKERDNPKILTVNYREQKDGCRGAWGWWVKQVKRTKECTSPDEH